MRYLALALFCASLFAFIATSGAVTVQITVFCNGGVVYDNAVTVTGSNPTAWDAIKASDACDDDELEGGWKLKSIAGCDGSWGPAFYVNGVMSGSGVAECSISDGDQLQFIGPNNGGPTAKILYLDEIPDAVGKGEAFRIKVMEKSAYDYYPHAPSSGAEVIVGNETYQTGSDGYTEEITLNYDAYYCVAAEKGGYVATYYFSDIPSIQCGVGGPYICSITMGGGRSGIIKYDESSSVYGNGFSSSRSVYVNSGQQYPRRSTKLYQKGSGNYSVEKIIKQRPSGIDLSESSQLEHNATTFVAYDRPLCYNSRYEDSIVQKNYHKATEYSEKYQDLESLRKVSLFNNTLGINFTSMAEFQGRAELSARTFEDDALTNWTAKARPKEEVFEEYIGQFQIMQRGFLPMGGNDEFDCEEECMWDCQKHCMEDLGHSESYCLENCTESCEDYCASDEEDYELVPCCSGGWSNMTEVDRNEHSAEGIFGCISCNKASNER